MDGRVRTFLVQKVIEKQIKTSLYHQTPPWLFKIVRARSEYRLRAIPRLWRSEAHFPTYDQLWQPVKQKITKIPFSTE